MLLALLRQALTDTLEKKGVWFRPAQKKKALPKILEPQISQTREADCKELFRKMTDDELRERLRDIAAS